MSWLTVAFDLPVPSILIVLTVGQVDWTVDAKVYMGITCKPGQ